jgi:hypothetical protein
MFQYGKLEKTYSVFSAFYGVYVRQYIPFVNYSFKMNLYDMLWMKLSYSCAFANFSKPTISFVCLSVCSHGTTRLQWKLYFHPGPPIVDLEENEVPFATLYTRPPEDGLQMGPKHVEVW